MATRKYRKIDAYLNKAENNLSETINKFGEKVGAITIAPSMADMPVPQSLAKTEGNNSLDKGKLIGEQLSPISVAQNDTTSAITPASDSQMENGRMIGDKLDSINQIPNESIGSIGTSDAALLERSRVTGEQLPAINASLEISQSMDRIPNNDSPIDAGFVKGTPIPESQIVSEEPSIPLPDYHANLVVPQDVLTISNNTEMPIAGSMASAISEVNPSTIASGELNGNTIMKSGYLRSSNYVAGADGWDIEFDGTAQFNNITLIGGSLRYGKTSFDDSTNPGYYLGSEGVYIGSASDATKLKFTIAGGAYDFIGTVSSRLTSTLALAIDVDGHFVDDTLSTASKTILDEFTFGVSGALQIGTYSNGVSGDIRISPNGILGRNSAGDTTFSIDGTTGDATFGGTLVAASGTFGTITSGSLTGLTITGGTIQTDTSGRRLYMTSSGLYGNDSDSHETMLLTGDGRLLIHNFTQDMGIYAVNAKINSNITFDGATLQNRPLIIDGGDYTNISHVLSLEQWAPKMGANATKTGTGTVSLVREMASGIGDGNTMDVFGTNKGTTHKHYKVEIDGVGSPNTFKWSDDGGSTWDATTVAITGSSQTLTSADGSTATLKFSGTTGGVSGDYWTFVLGSYTDYDDTFKRMVFFGTGVGSGPSLWLSDGTTPNGNLTGDAGDLCIYGDSGKMYICSGTTNWNTWNNSPFTHTYTAGENLSADEVVCLKNTYADIQPSDDTMDYSAYGDTNYNDLDDILMKANYGSGQEFGYMKFSMDSVPADIQLAILRFYHRGFTGSGPVTLTFSVADADWDEDTLTWNNHPDPSTEWGLYEGIGAGTIGTWIELDITHLVRGWKGGFLNNYGIVISVSGNSGEVRIDTKEEDGYEPHIRVWDNTTCDGKAYKAQDGEFDDLNNKMYPTVRNVLGIVTVGGNAEASITVQDVNGSIVDGVSGVTAGNIYNVSSAAGDLISTEGELRHITLVGTGVGSESIRLEIQKPYFVERFPINNASSPATTKYSYIAEIYPPTDANRCEIMVYDYYSAPNTYYSDSLTINRTGRIKDEYWQFGGAASLATATWDVANNKITLTGFTTNIRYQANFYR